MSEKIKLKPVKSRWRDPCAQRNRLWHRVFAFSLAMSILLILPQAGYAAIPVDLNAYPEADIDMGRSIRAGNGQIGQQPVPFPAGPADDNTKSLGSFRIYVAPQFRPLMTGYLGYDPTTFRLQSPKIYDPATVIGRSGPHNDGDVSDNGGTVVGLSSPSLVQDSDFSLVPVGDFNEGPVGTEEVHTEVQQLNMTAIGPAHPNCPGIPGMVAVRAGSDAPAQPFSPGEVESIAGVGFPGESFFNIFAEVDLPAMAAFSGGTLYNVDPLLVMDNNLNAFPPKVVYIHANSNAVPMLMRAPDPGGAWAANDVFGWLVLAGHGIDMDCDNPEDIAQFDAIMERQQEMPLPEGANSFPDGPSDDNTRSIGTFRIFVDPKFRPMMAGYPGYNASDHRLQSGLLYDPATVIGRSASHTDDSPADGGGTIVGVAGTSIGDGDFSLVPSGDFNEGPPGTNEIHTEVRELNMTPISISHPSCPGIPGTVAVRAGIDAPLQPVSPGEVEAKMAGGDFPAESFFNVFAEVDLPALGGFPGATLYNGGADPLLVMNNDLNSLPPQVVYTHNNTNAVPVRFRQNDPGGAWIAGERFGWLVLAAHGINYDCDQPEQVAKFNNIVAGLKEAPVALDESFLGGPADDNTRSIGSFRIFVAEEFRTLMAGYPGYNASDHRLQSGYLYDPATKIGRSSPHTDDSATDSAGTPVGTAGTIIADSDFSLIPVGDFNEGPAGTNEVHTEVRELNMTPINITHPSCPGIPGSVAVRAGIDAPAQPFSPGEVESLNTGNDFPAESFFNVFAEIDLPGMGGFPGGTLYNADPLLVINDQLTKFPPQVVYVHDNTNAVPVLFRSDDPGGAWSAGDVFGWLVLAGHGINYDCDQPEDVQKFDRVVKRLQELPLPLDHFKCYDIPSAEPVNTTVGLRDQFGSSEAAVLEPNAFCNPAAKQHNDQTTPIKDPDAHLKFYRIEDKGDTPPPTVKVANQFGKGQVLNVKEPAFLAAPAHKLLPGKHQSPKDLDHFKCYTVEGKAIEEVVQLRDQFETEPDARVLNPSLLCNPVEKRHDNIVHPIKSPEEHLVCYQIEATPFSQNVRDRTQFGEDGYTVVDPNMLCVPSRKKIIEVDHYERTRALVGIQMPGAASPVNIILHGPSTVHVDLGSLSDSTSIGAPGGNGLEELDTELVSMQLTANSALGPITLRGGSENGLQPSLGQIEEKDNIQNGRLDLPGPDAPLCTPPTPDDCVGTQANSFFDVFFEIEVAGMKLHNQNPLRIEAMINKKPPHTRYQHIITNPIELFDENGNATGIFLVTAEHDTRPELDHFKCYNILEGSPADAGVVLRDQFGQGDARVGDPYVFCNPTRKMHENSVTPIKDRDAHLEFYKLETGNEKLPPAVRVSNQFGERQKLEVLRPAYLAVPTQKHEPNQHAAPQNLDHFKCYEVTGKEISTVVQLEDQFQTEPDAKVLDPRLLCNPTDKQHNNNQTEMQSPEDHLVCYGIESAQFEMQVRYSNQFMEGDLHLGNPELLCVPSEKKVLEIDHYERTQALVGVRLPTGALVNVILSGPATIEVELSSLADVKSIGAPGANGLEEIDTELVHMELTGNSSIGTLTLRGGRDFNLNPSLGQIEEKVNVQNGRLDLPGPDAPLCTPPTPADCVGTQANSFFDVFFELEVPGAGKLHNEKPLRIESMIRQKPPRTRYRHVLTEPIELFDENGEPTGVFLVTAAHNTEPIEVDTFPRTIAAILIETPNGSEVVRLHGPTEVNVFIDDSNGNAEDKDNDGLDQVETEMVQLDLRGHSSMGPIQLGLNPDRPTTGEIREVENATPGTLDVPPFAPTGQADSFFDVFVDLEVGGDSPAGSSPNVVRLHNNDPIRMQSRLTHKPPAPIDIFQGPAEAVELFDPNNEPTGIRIIRIIHWPVPPIRILPPVRVVTRFTLNTGQGVEQMTLAGNVLTRSFINQNGLATDSDGDELDEVQTEIVSMNLTGNSPSLGNVELRLRKGFSATGQLEETVNVTPGVLDVPPHAPQGTADSFFDIWPEIQLGNSIQAASADGAPRVLHTSGPLRLQGTVDSQDPLGEDEYGTSSSESVELLEEDGSASGLSMEGGMMMEPESSGDTLLLPLIFE